jgi:hypothetical protein
MRYILPLLFVFFSSAGSAQAYTSADCANITDVFVGQELISSGVCSVPPKLSDGSAVPVGATLLFERGTYDPASDTVVLDPLGPISVPFWVDNDGTVIGSAVYPSDSVGSASPGTPVSLVSTDSFSCPAGSAPGVYAGYCLPLFSVQADSDNSGRPAGPVTYCYGLRDNCEGNPGGAVPSSGPIAALISANPALAVPPSGSPYPTGFSSTFARTGSLSESLASSASGFIDARTAAYVAIGLVLSLVVIVYHGKRIVHFMSGVDTNSAAYKAGVSQGKTNKNRRAGYRSGLKSRK